MRKLSTSDLQLSLGSLKLIKISQMEFTNEQHAPIPYLEVGLELESE